MNSLLKGMSDNRTGVAVLGVPLGSDDYIRNFLGDKVKRFISDFPALNKLTDLKLYLNLFVSASPRAYITCFAQSTRPSQERRVRLWTPKSRATS